MIEGNKTENRRNKSGVCREIRESLKRKFRLATLIKKSPDQYKRIRFIIPIQIS